MNSQEDPIYIYIYIYIHQYINIYTYNYIYAYVQTHTYIYIYVYIYRWVYYYILYTIESSNYPSGFSHKNPIENLRNFLRPWLLFSSFGGPSNCGTFSSTMPRRTGFFNREKRGWRLDGWPRVLSPLVDLHTHTYYIYILCVACRWIYIYTQRERDIVACRCDWSQIERREQRLCK